MFSLNFNFSNVHIWKSNVYILSGFETNPYRRGNTYHYCGKTEEELNLIYLNTLSRLIIEKYS